MNERESTNRVRVKLLTEQATMPTRAHYDDAGADLYASKSVKLEPGVVTKVPTDVALAVPSGYVGLIRDRSSRAISGLMTIAGVIDAQYRGHLEIVMINTTRTPVLIQPGEKIAQILIMPVLLNTFELTDNLNTTDRGDGGFGSTGR